MAKKKGSGFNSLIRFCDGGGRPVDGSIPSRVALTQLFERAGLRGTFGVSLVARTIRKDMSAYYGNQDVKILTQDKPKPASGIIALKKGATDYAFYRLFVPDGFDFHLVHERLCDAVRNPSKRFDQLKFGTVIIDREHSGVEQVYPLTSLVQVPSPVISGDDDERWLADVAGAVRRICLDADAAELMLKELRLIRSSYGTMLQSRRSGAGISVGGLATVVIEGLVEMLDALIKEKETFLSSGLVRFARAAVGVLHSVDYPGNG